MKELPLYRSHKTVRAAQIDRIDGGWIYLLGNHDPVPVEPEMFARYTPDHGDFFVVYDDGYKSISPQRAFVDGYRPVNDAPREESIEALFGFSTALRFVKDGKRVARRGWNGKDMFIFLVAGSRFEVNRAPLLGIYAPGTKIDYHAHIDMRTAQGQIVPWVASQTDMLAEDWLLVG